MGPGDRRMPTMGPGIDVCLPWGLGSTYACEDRQVGTKARPLICVWHTRRLARKRHRAISNLYCDYFKFCNHLCQRMSTGFPTLGSCLVIDGFTWGSRTLCPHSCYSRSRCVGQAFSIEGPASEIINITSEIINEL